MAKRLPLLALTLVLLTIAGAACAADPDPAPDPDPASLSEVQEFLGSQGFGQAHPEAPPAIVQFGQLVGIWHVEQEIRARDGRWVPSEPATWVWKYILGGFAVQDLWLQTADHLPAYLGPLGRSYQLTALRIWEKSSKTWRVAWAASGAGSTPGMDFGTLQGTGDKEKVVLLGESTFGKQRVTFSQIQADRFDWTSEYSQDGETWTAVMRVHARRVAEPAPAAESPPPSP